MFHRCTGNIPGQCGSTYAKCVDGSSSDIKEAQVGKCEQEDQLICTARVGRLAGKKVCLEKNFLCDNHVQCEDALDEDYCDKTYRQKRIFRHNANYVCPNSFMMTYNQTRKFYNIRAVQYSIVSS